LSLIGIELLLPRTETRPNSESVSVFLRGGAWHSYSCGQTVGWIKIPLGKEVGLGPGHIVLDGDPVGAQPHTAPPHFRPMPIVVKRSPISATVKLLLWMGWVNI